MNSALLRILFNPAPFLRVVPPLLVAAALSACGGGRSTPAPGPAQLAVAVPAVPVPDLAPLTRLQALGQKIFNDHNLSEPRGMACVTCHAPQTGFAGNNGSVIGVAFGSRPGVLGLRNAMTNAYAGFIPAFSWRVDADDGDTDPVGGHFWDARADTLALQATMPFLAAAEMNNPSAAALVGKVALADYAGLMKAEFGNGVFADPAQALLDMGSAIAAFETSGQLQQFSSKYDSFIKGVVPLSPAENRGMLLFMDPKRANCASCHLMNPASANPQDSLFSDFSLYANGIPRNSAIPENANPGFFDLGLCGPARTRPALGANVPASVSIERFCGTFKMPMLRNVAAREAFMHNGFFKNLKEVVEFYATRNSNPTRWYGPAGVPNDLPVAYLPNIQKDHAPFNSPPEAGPVLTPAEIDDVVAFLKTLTDGYKRPASSTTPAPAPTP